MKLRCVLFDLDGTLLPMDQEEFTKAYFHQLAKKLAHLIACTGCGETMPFEDGYAYIQNQIQKERLHFIYQCGARNILFDEVLALVA